MIKVPVKLQNSDYEVIIGRNIFSKIHAEITNKKLHENIFCVIDRKVYSLHKEIILKQQEKFRKFKTYLLTANEKNKQLNSAEKIYARMMKEKFGRDTTIVAIGGGVIGDISGFAASTYMRGVNLVHIPTTILAAADSSIGGKTGVNFGETKNIIGSFYQPDLVLTDTKFFYTLPEEEILSGLGEIIKYAFLTNDYFFDYVTKNLFKFFKLENRTIEKVLLESVKFKGSVVENDEKESGLRKILNLGHTFGHGIEVEQNYRLKHGAAVIIGITSSLFLSKQLNLISAYQFEKYISLCEKFKDKIQVKKFNPDNIYKIMLRDKKNKDGKIRLVLVKDIGKLVLDVSAHKKEIISAIKSGISIFG